MATALCTLLTVTKRGQLHGENERSCKGCFQTGRSTVKDCCVTVSSCCEKSIFAQWNVSFVTSPSKCFSVTRCKWWCNYIRLYIHVLSIHLMLFILRNVKWWLQHHQHYERQPAGSEKVRDTDSDSKCEKSSCIQDLESLTKNEH